MMAVFPQLHPAVCRQNSVMLHTKAVTRETVLASVVQMRVHDFVCLRLFRIPQRVIPLSLQLWTGNPSSTLTPEGIAVHAA